jgi:hypothetical protein
MLWHKIQGAGGLVQDAPLPTFVGGVFSSANLSSPLNELSVASISDPGDLVVVALSSDNSMSSPSWDGLALTEILFNGSANPSAYVGWGIQPDPPVDVYGTTSPFSGGGAYVSLAAVFRGADTLVNSGAASGSSGMPNPPSVAASAQLWVATAHLDDDPITFGAPTSYTIATQGEKTSGFSRVSGAIAYRIQNLSSDNPGAFTGEDGSDEWRAVLAAFS